MIFGMTFYQLAWLFVIYSFLGWCVEVIYHAVTWGEVTNRGFLNDRFARYMDSGL